MRRSAVRSGEVLPDAQRPDNFDIPEISHMPAIGRTRAIVCGERNRHLLLNAMRSTARLWAYRKPRSGINRLLLFRFAVERRYRKYSRRIDKASVLANEIAASIIKRGLPRLLNTKSCPFVTSDDLLVPTPAHRMKCYSVVGGRPLTATYL